MTPPNTAASECRGDHNGASLKETGIQLFSNCHFKRARRERGLEGILKEKRWIESKENRKKKKLERIYGQKKGLEIRNGQRIKGLRMDTSRGGEMRVGRRPAEED